MDDIFVKMCYLEHPNNVDSSNEGSSDGEESSQKEEQAQALEENVPNNSPQKAEKVYYSKRKT